MRIHGSIWRGRPFTGRHLDVSMGLVVGVIALLWLAIGLLLILLFL